MIKMTIRNTAQIERDNERNKEKLREFVDFLKAMMEVELSCSLMMYEHRFSDYFYISQVKKNKRRFKFLSPSLKEIRRIIYLYFSFHRKLSEQSLQCEFWENIPKKSKEKLIMETKKFAEKVGFAGIDFSIFG